MKLKRLLAVLLATAAVCALTAVPAQAGQFPDIVDPNVSLAADTLYALGVIDGTDKGLFLPESHLTRVEFCKMAIEIMGKGDLALAQMNRTIFTDVGGAHWGRGYVNLAATMILDESSGTRLMLGSGDGYFWPDRDISYQEAATIILRMLGYGEQANQSWPYGAIQAAAELGLDKGVGVSDPAAPMTRGQAALLFCRLLAVPAKGETEPYAHTLCTLVEDAIILSTNATINGQSGWVVTTEGGPYRSSGLVDSDLLGRRGDILLDSDGRFITLLIDESQCATVTVARVQGDYITTSAGTRYTFASDTPVYSGSTGEVSTYAEMLPSILPGDVVTIYLEEGKVIGMFRSATTAASGFLVARGTVSAADLMTLTGGDYDYTIRKNGSTISSRDISAYDVLTYDPISKVIYACDTRIKCVYENAYPSPSAPSSVTVLGGNTFEVMTDAMSSFSQFSIGDSFTLLFTSDGRVAGAVERGVAGNAMGVVSGNQLTLLGINKTLDLSKSDDAADFNGELVSVSGSRGQASLSRISLSRSDGSFEKSSMQLGRLSVSDRVQIYERGVNGLTAVSLTSLASSVPENRISGYHTDSSGRVDLIVLRNYTGDSYTYGLIEPTSRFIDVEVEGDPIRVDEHQYFWVDGNIVDRYNRIVIRNVFNPFYEDVPDDNDPGTTEGNETLPEDSTTPPDGSETPPEDSTTPPDESETPPEVKEKPAGWYDLGEDGYVRDEDGYRIDEDENRLDDNNHLLDRRGEVVMEKQEIPQLKFTTIDDSVIYDVEEGTRVRTCFGTISVYKDRKTKQEYAEVDSTLTEISGVRSADFYTSDGVTYVQARGKTYEVADDVQCLNAAASSSRRVWDESADDYVYVTVNEWFDSLLEARTFSATVTIYVDSVGQRVRIVSVE